MGYTTCSTCDKKSVYNVCCRKLGNLERSFSLSPRNFKSEKLKVSVLLRLFSLQLKQEFSSFRDNINTCKLFSVSLCICIQTTFEILLLTGQCGKGVRIAVPLYIFLVSVFPKDESSTYFERYHNPLERNSLKMKRGMCETDKNTLKNGIKRL